MPSRSPTRGRPRTRSPYSDERPDSRSPSRLRRTISPRSPSRSPRRNGRYRSGSRSSRGRSPSPIRSTKVVIEKLTKNVTDDHLREIFGSYGQIRDLDMPMNRQFMTNRGTAYVLYTNEADAEAAIAHMHESQLDGAVINVSIVLPRRKFSPSPPLARRAVVDRGPPSAGFRGPPPPRRRSPPPSYSRADRGERNLTLTDQPHDHARDLRDIIARTQDHPRPVPAPGLDLHHVDVAADGIVQVETAAEDEEVQAIAVTAVMMIEAEAEVAHVVEGEGAKDG